MRERICVWFANHRPFALTLSRVHQEECDVHLQILDVFAIGMINVKHENLS